jgi:hypothetical protein
MPYKDYEEHLAYRRRYKKTSKFKKCTQFYDAAKHANERAAKYGAAGKIAATDVRRILSPDARCQYCNRLASETDEVFGRKELGIDHRVPLHAGGPNTVSNIVPCCHSCNAKKHRRPFAGAWSAVSLSCVACGSTMRKHIARGMCGRCYQRQQ